MKAPRSSIILSILIVGQTCAALSKNVGFCSEETGSNLSNVLASVKPDPIVLHKDEVLTAHISMDLLTNLDANSTVEVEMYKVGIVPLPPIKLHCEKVMESRLACECEMALNPISLLFTVTGT